MRFENKVVWITGASSGIGEALAVALSHEGATLVLSARNQRELERVRGECASPDRHRVLPLDLTDTNAIFAAAKEVPRVDVLVHSGGVSQRSFAADTDLSIDRQIMETNYFGTIALTKAVLPSMLARRSGHIVPISSVIGYVGIPTRTAYAASKHALHGFFEALRAETAKDGIAITIVVPGYIRTKVSENALRGDGTRHGMTDETHEKAMLPEVAARKIVDAIARRKPEVYVGGKEIWAVTLRRFLPRLTARLTRAK